DRDGLLRGRDRPPDRGEARPMGLRLVPGRRHSRVSKRRHRARLSSSHGRGREARADGLRRSRAVGEARRASAPPSDQRVADATMHTPTGVRRVVVAVSVLVLVLASVMPGQVAAQQRPLDKITLRLDWVNLGFHSLWYYGRDKGVFAEHGLDLEVLEGRGSDL